LHVASLSYHILFTHTISSLFPLLVPERTRNRHCGSQILVSHERHRRSRARSITHRDTMVRHVPASAPGTSSPPASLPIHALTTSEIQKLVRTQRVDARVSLDVYFRTAEHVALQAKVFRAEHNLPQLYRLLYAYVSIVLDTMSEHGDWTSARFAERVRREEARTKSALEEMEVLQPIIDAEAEEWKRAVAVARPVAVERPPPVEGTGRGSGNLGGGLGVASGEEGTRREAPASVGVVLSGEVKAKHSMFAGSRLPSAAETAHGVQSAAANATGGSDATPRRDVGEGPKPSQKAPSSSGTGPRHAHSLLPPPPAPPPAEDDAFAQSIIPSAASVEFQPKVIVQVPTTDEAATDHTRLDTRLKLYGLREKVVRGDGNCQFRAIADQLFRDQERHAECRTVVINQLRRAAEEYAPYVPEDYDTYVETMRKDTTWGDHITLQAAADAYGVAMCVISSYKDNFVVEIQPKVKRSSRVCWISFWAEVHYNSVYPADAS